MNKEVKKGLVPELRFPEFQNAEDWQTGMLGDKNFATFVKERTPLEKLNLESYVSTENLLPDYAGVTIASKLPPAGSCTRFKTGDVLISNIRPYLKKVWIANKDGASSNDVIVIRSQQKVSDSFLALLLKNDEFINYIMKGAKGVKMPRGDISLMREYIVAFPTKESGEQTKIAACLSSLDDLITAQTQKIEALKTHKKGLMQQIFPQEGETVPKLRFPEFEGDWENLCITKIAKISIGLVTTMTTNYCDVGVPLIRNSDIQQNKIKKENLIFLTHDFAEKYPSKKLKEGDIVTVHTGDIGVSCVIDKSLEGCLGFATLNTRLTNQNVLPAYLCWYLNTSRYINFAKSMATGDGRENFNLKDFDKSIIPITSLEEQTKIANCLSSLDDLINSHVKKCELLKTHKKGLMQGLFPSSNEAA